MAKLVIDAHSEIPPFKQVVNGLLDQILGGTLAPGDRLPSIRELAIETLVNPNTIAKAVRELTWLGAVQTRSGSGVFVSDEGLAIARRERTSATLESFRKAASAALRSGHSAIDLEATLLELSGTAHTKSKRRSS